MASNVATFSTSTAAAITKSRTADEMIDTTMRKEEIEEVDSDDDDDMPTTLSSVNNNSNNNGAITGQVTSVATGCNVVSSLFLEASRAPVVKEGHLNIETQPKIKSGSNSGNSIINMMKQWKKKYFVLRGNMLLYFNSKKHFTEFTNIQRQLGDDINNANSNSTGQDHAAKKKKIITISSLQRDKYQYPQGVITLARGIQIGPSPDRESKTVHHCFKIITTKKCFYLSAHSERDQRDWMSKIRTILRDLNMEASNNENDDNNATKRALAILRKRQSVIPNVEDLDLSFDDDNENTADNNNNNDQEAQRVRSLLQDLFQLPENQKSILCQFDCSLEHQSASSLFSLFVQGTMYLTHGYICFHSVILGNTTQRVISIETELQSISALSSTHASSSSTADGTCLEIITIPSSATTTTTASTADGYYNNYGGGAGGNGNGGGERLVFTFNDAAERDEFCKRAKQQSWMHTRYGTTDPVLIARKQRQEMLKLQQQQQQQEERRRQRKEEDEGDSDDKDDLVSTSDDDDDDLSTDQTRSKRTSGGAGGTRSSTATTTEYDDEDEYDEDEEEEDDYNLDFLDDLDDNDYYEGDGNEDNLDEEEDDDVSTSKPAVAASQHHPTNDNGKGMTSNSNNDNDDDDYSRNDDGDDVSTASTATTATAATSRRKETQVIITSRRGRDYSSSTVTPYAMAPAAPSSSSSPSSYRNIDDDPTSITMVRIPHQNRYNSGGGSSSNGNNNNNNSSNSSNSTGGLAADHHQYDEEKVFRWAFSKYYRQKIRDDVMPIDEFLLHQAEFCRAEALVFNPHQRLAYHSNNISNNSSATATTNNNSNNSGTGGGNNFQLFSLLSDSYMNVVRYASSDNTTATRQHHHQFTSPPQWADCEGYVYATVNFIWFFQAKQGADPLSVLKTAKSLPRANINDMWSIDLANDVEDVRLVKSESTTDRTDIQYAIELVIRDTRDRLWFAFDKRARRYFEGISSKKLSSLVVTTTTAATTTTTTAGTPTSATTAPMSPTVTFPTITVSATSMTSTITTPTSSSSSSGGGGILTSPGRRPNPAAATHMLQRVGSFSAPAPPATNEAISSNGRVYTYVPMDERQPERGFVDMQERRMLAQKSPVAFEMFTLWYFLIKKSRWYRLRRAVQLITLAWHRSRFYRDFLVAQQRNKQLQQQQEQQKEATSKYPPPLNIQGSSGDLNNNSSSNNNNYNSNSSIKARRVSGALGSTAQPPSTICLTLNLNLSTQDSLPTGATTTTTTPPSTPPYSPITSPATTPKSSKSSSHHHHHHRNVYNNSQGGGGGGDGYLYRSSSMSDTMSVSSVSSTSSPRSRPRVLSAASSPQRSQRSSSSPVIMQSPPHTIQFYEEPSTIVLRKYAARKINKRFSWRSAQVQIVIAKNVLNGMICIDVVNKGKVQYTKNVQEIFDVDLGDPLSNEFTVTFKQPNYNKKRRSLSSSYSSPASSPTPPQPAAVASSETWVFECAQKHDCVRFLSELMWQLSTSPEEEQDEEREQDRYDDHHYHVEDYIYDNDDLAPLSPNNRSLDFDNLSISGGGSSGGGGGDNRPHHRSRSNNSSSLSNSTSFTADDDELTEDH